MRRLILITMLLLAGLLSACGGEGDEGDSQGVPPGGAEGVVVRDPIGVASGVRSHLAARPAALVAIAAHARSGVDRMRFGATAAEIVAAATAPALVVPIVGGDS